MVEAIYREAPPSPDLADHVRCVWVKRVGTDEAARPIRVVPDGCTDLMWLDGELVVAGPDTTAQLSRAAAGAVFVGVRFAPGAGPAVLGAPADELRDARLDAAALWGSRAAAELAARLADAVRGGAGIGLDGAVLARDVDASGRQSDAAVAGRGGDAAVPGREGDDAGAARIAALLQDAVRRRLAGAPEPDRAVRHLVAAVERRRAPRVDRLADELGLGERQLRRRCAAALGYGPKTFAGIVRFQRFLAVAGSARLGPGPLAALALVAGYADQAHLTREVRRLSGLSPRELLAGPAVADA